MLLVEYDQLLSLHRFDFVTNPILLSILATILSIESSKLRLGLDNYHHNCKLIVVEASGMTMKESYNLSIHCRMAKKKDCMCLMNCNLVDPDNIDHCQNWSSRDFNHFLVEVSEVVNISEKFVAVYPDCMS